MTHTARFPGTINDPSKETVSERQAKRLATLTRQPTAAFKGKTLGELRRADLHLDPSLFLARTICGRVVKTDADGKDHPVPFATVNVYDTDLGLLGWSPASSPYSWFYPLFHHRELLRTVTTDECGRFCVRIPRWEIDYYLRWRLERKCYLTWLRKPTLRDLLEQREVLPPRPGPDPGPLHVDDHLLRHAERVLDAAGLARLRRLGPSQLGDLEARTTATMTAPGFAARVRPPLDKKAQALLAGDRATLARRLALPPELLRTLDPARWWGPYLRCRTVIVPEWTPVLDVPDLTFEVLQDVDGDGTPEVIYSEGLFDVRWDAGAIPDVTLHASQIAHASPLCDVPDVPDGIAPAILFAGNYPLKQPAPSTGAAAYQDDLGYSKLVNRPDDDGDAATPARHDPAQAPFTGSFYLIGSAEAAGATHYRIAHEVGGVTTYLTGGFGPLARMVGNAYQTRVIAPVDGPWYPIVPKAEGWSPGGILAPVDVGDDAGHGFRIELGAASGGAIAAIPGSLTNPVRVWVDTTRPTVAATLEWRHPDAVAPDSPAWQTLGLAACPVVARRLGQRVQFRFTVTVSAHHLRDYAINASGCGGPNPTLITTARDGLPATAPSATRHWHTSPGDNTATVTLYYELPAGAPAGCYHFAVSAQSRAFDPRATVNLAPAETPEHWWQVNEQAPIYTPVDYAVAIQ